MDPFNQKQFQLNQQTIAQFAGLMPSPREYYYIEKAEELVFPCAECPREVTLKELDRNAGICDCCAEGK